MSADHAVSIVNIEGIAGVSHCNGSSQQMIPLSAADHRDLACHAYGFHQTPPGCKLVSIAAQHQRAQQVNAAHFGVSLYGCGQRRPLRIYRIPLRAVVRYKFHSPSCSVSGCRLRRSGMPAALPGSCRQYPGTPGCNGWSQRSFSGAWRLPEQS